MIQDIPTLDGRRDERQILTNDLAQDESRAVPTSEGQAFAAQYGCTFLECSAKRGENVQGAFEELVREIVKRRLAEPPAPSKLPAANNGTVDLSTSQRGYLPGCSC